MSKRVLHQFFPGDLVNVHSRIKNRSLSDTDKFKKGLIVSVFATCTYPYFNYVVRVADEEVMSSKIVSEKFLSRINKLTNKEDLSIRVGYDVKTTLGDTNIFRVCEIMLLNGFIRCDVRDIILTDYSERYISLVCCEMKSDISYMLKAPNGGLSGYTRSFLRLIPSLELAARSRWKPVVAHDLSSVYANWEVER